VEQVEKRFLESPLQEAVKEGKNLYLVRQISWEEVRPALLPGQDGIVSSIFQTHYKKYRSTLFLNRYWLS
jgi:hypothetical protein